MASDLGVAWGRCDNRPHGDWKTRQTHYTGLSLECNASSVADRPSPVRSFPAVQRTMTGPLAFAISVSNSP